MASRINIIILITITIAITIANIIIISRINSGEICLWIVRSSVLWVSLAPSLSLSGHNPLSAVVPRSWSSSPSGLLAGRFGPRRIARTNRSDVVWSRGWGVRG